MAESRIHHLLTRSDRLGDTRYVLTNGGRAMLKRPRESGRTLATCHCPRLGRRQCKCRRLECSGSELIERTRRADLTVVARRGQSVCGPMERSDHDKASHDWLRTYAIPRILLTRPTFVKSKPLLMALTDGHENVTSPPPSGGCPRFVIWRGVERTT